MFPVLDLGGWQLRTYGLIVAASFLVALWLGKREARRTGLDPAVIEDFALFALVGGIVGARLYFAAFSEPAYFLERPSEILYLWRGGLGIIGGLAGGALAALWFCRRRGVPFWRLADTVAPGVALGQAVGILACLGNGDSYGSPADLPWSIVYTDPRAMAPLGVPLHPVELYEMAAYLAVFALVWAVRARLATPGYTFLAYAAAYGLARVSVEFFRGDPALLAPGIPAAQAFGAALVLASIAGFPALRRAKRLPRRPA